MQRSIDRRLGLAAVTAASLALGCAGVPVHPAAPYPNPSRVAQGALLGGLAGAAVGAGVDHHHRGRGALVGGLGGVIVGAIFGDQIRQHEAWHRAHEAPPPHDCHDPSLHDGHDCDCAHAWEEEEPDYGDEHTWDDDYAREDPVPEPPQPDPALGVPEVLFDPGSATLTRGAEARLRYLARQVRDRDDVELLLRGHSDQRETDGFELSELRARAVRAFLAEEGVSVRRIAWVGLGDAQPVASNETAAGRQRNRRVEVVLRAPDRDPYS